MTERKFRVTEDLKRELRNCAVNSSMKEIYNLKTITIRNPVKLIKECGTIEYRIKFVEVEDGYWFYSKKFYDELMRNEIKYFSNLSLE